MKRSSLFFSCFFLSIVLGLGVGCAKKPDDAKISSAIQARFAQDSGLSTKQLSVQSANGVVTISGTVDNAAQRDAASRQAASEPGVKEVVNNLVVGSAPPTETAASAPPQQQEPETNPSARSAKPNAGKKAKAQKQESTEPENSANASNNEQAANQPPASDNSQPAAPPPDTSAEATPPPPPPPGPKQLIIDQGTQLTVRLIDPIDSEKNVTGDTFHATLNTPLSSDGEEAVPAGVELTGHLVDVESASKFSGKPVVVMQLDMLSYAGKTYSLQTDQYRKEGKERGKNTAEKVGGGAILGGIIGAIAGGGKGAAIGAAAGAGAGGAAQAASKSPAIKLPAETVLTFTLQNPIEVLKPPATDANRPKLQGQQ
jgi:hypothetical protein